MGCQLSHDGIMSIHPSAAGRRRTGKELKLTDDELIPLRPATAKGIDKPTFVHTQI